LPKGDSISFLDNEQSPLKWTEEKLPGRGWFGTFRRQTLSLRLNPYLNKPIKATGMGGFEKNRQISA